MAKKKVKNLNDSSGEITGQSENNNSLFNSGKLILVPVFVEKKNGTSYMTFKKRFVPD